MRSARTRSCPCPWDSLLPRYSSSSWVMGCFHAMAISIFALPFFSLASISSERSPSGNTVISSSPMERDSARDRMPSAMRLSASAASDGDAAPSNSNSCLSPMTSSRCGDFDEGPARPPERHLHPIAPLALLDLEVEEEELGRRDDRLLVIGHNPELAGENALGELREVEGRGVPTGSPAESSGDASRHVGALTARRPARAHSGRARRGGFCL